MTKTDIYEHYHWLIRCHVITVISALKLCVGNGLVFQYQQLLIYLVLESLVFFCDINKVARMYYVLSLEKYLFNAATSDDTRDNIDVCRCKSFQESLKELWPFWFQDLRTSVDYFIFNCDSCAICPCPQNTENLK